MFGIRHSAVRALQTSKRWGRYMIDSICFPRFVKKLTSITASLETQQTSINEIYAEGAVEGYSAECPFCIGLCWPRHVPVMWTPKMISTKYVLNCLRNTEFSRTWSLPRRVLTANALWPSYQSNSLFGWGKRLRWWPTTKPAWSCEGLDFCPVISIKTLYSWQCQSLHFTLDKHVCRMLRAQESLSMEARSKSIPLPKAKCSAAPAGKAKAKAKVKAKAKPEPAPAKAAPKRAAARASWDFSRPHVTMNLVDYWWGFLGTTKNVIVYVLHRLCNVRMGYFHGSNLELNRVHYFHMASQLPMIYRQRSILTTSGLGNFPIHSSNI